MNLTEDQIEVMKRMNERAMKIAQIDSYFHGKKLPIDLKYLDSLSDEKLDEIYQNHCNGK
jgi:hypothetical protein